MNIGHRLLLHLMVSHPSFSRCTLFLLFECVNCETSLISFKFVLEHLFEVLTELILSLEDHILFRRVHIHVDLLSRYVYRQVYEV